MLRLSQQEEEIMAYIENRIERRSSWRAVVAAWLVAGFAFGALSLVDGRQSEELRSWAVNQGTMIIQLAIPGLSG